MRKVSATGRFLIEAGLLEWPLLKGLWKEGRGHNLRRQGIIRFSGRLSINKGHNAEWISPGAVSTCGGAGLGREGRDKMRGEGAKRPGGGPAQVSAPASKVSGMGMGKPNCDLMENSPKKGE